MGLSLPVMARGGADNLGSDFTVVLQAFSGGAAVGPVLASAAVSRDVLTPGVMAWVSVPFAQPYEQTAGESLCFIITNSSFGSAGYNEHGYANANPYAAGAYLQTSSQITGGADLGFETLVVDPVPAPLPLPQAGAYTGTARGVRSLVPEGETSSAVAYTSTQRALARLFADGRLHLLFGDHPETALTTGQLGTLVAKLSGAGGAYSVATAAGTVEGIVVTPKTLKFAYVAPASAIDGPEPGAAATLQTRIIFTLTRTGR